MSSISGQSKLTPAGYPCDSLQVGYGIAVTAVALTIIFGALVLFKQHYHLHFGPFDPAMKWMVRSLGQYAFVPLAISGPLWAVMIASAICCPKSPDLSLPESDTAGVDTGSDQEEKIRSIRQKKLQAVLQKKLQYVVREPSEDGSVSVGKCMIHQPEMQACARAAIAMKLIDMKVPFDFADLSVWEYDSVALRELLKKYGYKWEISLCRAMTQKNAIQTMSQLIQDSGSLLTYASSDSYGFTVLVDAIDADTVSFRDPFRGEQIVMETSLFWKELTPTYFTLLPLTT